MGLFWNQIVRFSKLVTELETFRLLLNGVGDFEDVFRTMSNLTFLSFL